MSAMTTSIISQFVTKIEEVPISGIDAERKSCIYKVVFEKSDDTTFLVITGPKINSYGDSKLKIMMARNKHFKHCVDLFQNNKIRYVVCMKM